MYLTKILFLFGLITSIFSSTTLTMDSFLEEGILYKIKNERSETCLNARGTLQGKPYLKECTQDLYEDHELWFFKKEGEFYKIENHYNGNLLYHTRPIHALYPKYYSDKHHIELCNKKNQCANTHGVCVNMYDFTIMHIRDGQEDNAAITIDSLWAIEHNKEFYKIRSRTEYNGGMYLCGQSTDGHADEPSVYICNDNPRGYSDRNWGNSWSFEKYDPYKRYNIFFSSLISGVAYSFFPELCREILESRGYSGVSINIAATLVQGGISLCNTASYIPTLTGMAIRGGFHQLGFSQQTSAIAGSTAVVVVNVSQSLIFNQGTFIDHAVDCSLAIAGSSIGSYLALKATPWVCKIAATGAETGSTLAFKAKTWFYELWENNLRRTSKQILLEKEREIESLKKERDELYALTSETPRKVDIN